MEKDFDLTLSLNHLLPLNSEDNNQNSTPDSNSTHANSFLQNQNKSMSENKWSMPKPDFSIFENSLQGFSYKKEGYLKNQKNFYLNTPVKSKKKRKEFSFEGMDHLKINLFGNNGLSPDENDNKLYNETFLSKKRRNNFMDDSLIERRENLAKGKLTELFENLISKEKNGLLIGMEYNYWEKIKKEKEYYEDNFIALRKLNEKNSYTSVNLCQEGLEKNYCVIKTCKNKTAIERNLKFILETEKFKEKEGIKNCFIFPTEYWMEERGLRENPVLRIKQKYFPNGDILAYLTKEEKNNKKRLNDPLFFMDLIYEMLLCLYITHNIFKMIHLNLTPSNFIVDEEEHLRLIGFSYFDLISNSNSFDLLNDDSTYVSPEVFREEMNKIGEKSDIYSLGLCIWEILTKIDLPSGGEKWQELREGIIIKEASLKNFKDLNEDSLKVLNDINNLVSSMIKKNPKERPTALEILQSNDYFKEKFGNFINSLE
ncbi:MAG: protein kinase [archaeon]|nr:protein kinase [archaeon]